MGLLSTMHLLGRVVPINIYGPAELENIIDHILKAGEARFAYEINFHAIQEGESRKLFDDEKIEIHTFPLIHKIQTNGFRIVEKEKPRKLLADLAKEQEVPIEYYHRLKLGEDIHTDGKSFLAQDYTEPGNPSKSYAYCSDTMYNEGMLDDVKNVDLLYHEATFVEHLKDRARETKHSTAIDAAKIAKKANVGRLLLGHISARYDSGEMHLKEAVTVFPESQVVEDGDIFEID
jgi:ribonuclease Z